MRHDLGRRPVSLVAETCLRCPECGEQYLHQCDVGIYHHRIIGYALEQQVLVYTGGTVQEGIIPEGTAMNPSGERQGIRISFWCEHDCRVPDLLVYQDQGGTYIEWDSEKRLGGSPQGIIDLETTE